MNRDKDPHDLNNQKSDVERMSNTKDEDISEVDRQEGEMNNGELGGDFKETKNNSGTKK